MTEENNICSVCLSEITEHESITPCNHRFHTQCLLRAVVRSGHNCPYCRHQLVETSPPLTWETLLSENITLRRQNTADNNYVPFYERLGTPPPFPVFDDDDDVAAMTIEELNGANEPSEEEKESEPTDEQRRLPTVEYVLQQLTEQGVTARQMVSAALLDHPEYRELEDEFREASDDIFGRICNIIRDYR